MKVCHILLCCWSISRGEDDHEWVNNWKTNIRVNNWKTNIRVNNWKTNIRVNNWKTNIRVNNWKTNITVALKSPFNCCV